MTVLHLKGYITRHGVTYCDGCINYLGPDYDCPKTGAIIIRGYVNGKCNEYQKEPEEIQITKIHIEVK